jgi:hypothetical protein
MEQQAQSKFGAATAMLDQIAKQDELREKERAAEYGYAGKGLGAEASIGRAQIMATAQQAARAYTADVRSKNVQTQILLGQYLSNTSTPQQKEAALTELQQKDPDWQKMDPTIAQAVVNNLPPAYQQQVANVYKTQQQAQAIAHGNDWADRLNDAKYQLQLDQASKTIADRALAMAQVGKVNADVNQVAANTQHLQQIIQQYPDDVKAKAAAAESSLALNATKIQLAQQQLLAKTPGSQQNLIDLAKDQMKLLKDKADMAGAGANKYVVNGMAPADGVTGHDDYVFLMNQRREALNAQQDIQKRLTSMMEKPTVVTPNVPAYTLPSVGGAAAHGTNPNVNMKGPINLQGPLTVEDDKPSPQAAKNIQIAKNNYATVIQSPGMTPSAKLAAKARLDAYVRSLGGK